MRDDVAGIPFSHASPQQRRARPPGTDIDGVGAFALSQSLDFQSVGHRRHNLHGISADADAIARRKVR